MSAAARVIPPVLTLAELGKLGEAVARDSGESVGIFRLSGELASSGLLFKQYKKTAAQTGRATALGQLIDFGRATSDVGKTQREVLLGATSWPVAKVTDQQGELLGCLIPEAGKKFRWDGGGLREIDTLAQPDERLAARGLSSTPAQRLAVCRGIVQVAAALERRGLVYSDWNYANALWSSDDHSVFIIDIDGCRQGQMPNIFQNDWEDPLTSGSVPADTYTDRYRVALLTARCLTGQRILRDVLLSLNDAADNVIPGRTVLLDMLWAADRSTRPSSRNLRASLDGANLRFPVQRMPLPDRPARRAAKQTPPDKTIKATKLTVTPQVPAQASAGQPRQPGQVAKNTKRSPAVVTASVLGGVLALIIVLIIIAVVAH